jgi:hypothetical protein
MKAARAFELGLADFLCGLVTLTTLGLGSRVYVRRLQIWLDARSSGQAMSFGGTDLSAATLAANDDQRGVLQ